jgi:succinate dehydrogenase/fumarate reductase-like Fe-S protein
MSQRDADRVQEFRKCIECFLCQDVCHVLRDHGKHEAFIGPRFFTYSAALEMHPLDAGDRLRDLKDEHGLGYCNITKCCTRAHPHHRQCDHSAQGAGRGPLLRSGDAPAQDVQIEPQVAEMLRWLEGGS